MSSENNHCTAQVEHCTTDPIEALLEDIKDTLTKSSAVEDKIDSKESALSETSSFVINENISLMDVEGLDTSAAKSEQVLKEDCERLVSEIIKLGYKREDVENALEFSHNNSDKAIEILLNQEENTEETSIEWKKLEPQNKIQTTKKESQIKLPEAPENEQSSDTPAIEELFDAGPLSFLRAQSEFQRLKFVLNQNPRLLNVVLQKMNLSIPSLFHLISENQECFFKLLTEPVICDENSSSSKDDDDETTADSNKPLESSSVVKKKKKLTFEHKEAIEQLTTTSDVPEIPENSGH